MFHPPHPTHVHPPHIEEPQSPGGHFIHPDVTRARATSEVEAQRRSWEVARRHPLLGLTLAALCFVPTTHISFQIASSIGWYVLLPPVCLVLLLSPVFVIVIGGVIVFILSAIGKRLPSEHAHHAADWLDDAWVYFGAAGSFAGIPAGLLLFVVSKIG